MDDRSEPYRGEPGRDFPEREHAGDSGDEPARGDPRDDGRDEQGRFLPERSGNPDTQWGADNPPPRSPGRPKRDAWVKHLEKRLEDDPRIGQALADKLLKIALKGKDSDALRAIQEIQDRTGGPTKLRVDGMSEEELTTALTAVMRELVKHLPPEYHHLITAAAYKVFAGEESKWVVIDQKPD